MNRGEGDLWRGERIGILGGTFDPPHTGHVGMAAAARDVLGLDRVFFSPAPNPPHKIGDPVTALEDRRAMIEAAIAEEPAFSLADIEGLDRPSFTVDLLRAAVQRTSGEIYFILGADSLAEIGTWREPGEVLRLCTLVVFPRDATLALLPVAGAASVVVFESPRFDVSSTEIRDRLATGREAGGKVPRTVAAYIERRGLYRRH